MVFDAQHRKKSDILFLFSLLLRVIVTSFFLCIHPFPHQNGEMAVCLFAVSTKKISPVQPVIPRYTVHERAFVFQLYFLFERQCRCQGLH